MSGNGRPHAPSAEEQAIAQAAVNGAGAEAYGALQLIFPLMPEQQRQQIAAGVAGDVLKLGPVIKKLFEGELGTVGVRFERKSLVQLVGLERPGDAAPGANPGIGINGLAKISEITTPNDVMAIVCTIAMLTSPTCRALVTALGYTTRFMADPRLPAEIAEAQSRLKKTD